MTKEIMMQEVEITLKAEMDAEMSKTEIQWLVQHIVDNSPIRREVILKVHKVREEADIYGTEKLGLEDKTEHDAKIVSSFIYHCKENGTSIDDSMFESFFDA
jgi:hypothetical protein